MLIIMPAYLMQAHIVAMNMHVQHTVPSIQTRYFIALYMHIYYSDVTLLWLFLVKINVTIPTLKNVF